MHNSNVSFFPFVPRSTKKTVVASLSSNFLSQVILNKTGAEQTTFSSEVRGQKDFLSEKGDFRFNLFRVAIFFGRLKIQSFGVKCDEAHFWLNGYVNKQNCRIWSEANPQVYVETPLHPKKLTGALYGLVESFFKNDEGHNVTVNGDRYRAMITNFFIPELNNHDVQELWFQQDGATCHTARATIDLLKDTFGNHLISRFGPVNWPPRSCDLTPLDYFLWGYVKSLVYADKPQTLDHLEDNIRRVIADIRPQMLEKVIENWTSRLDFIRASRGNPIPEIIFKK
ncbi:DUF4817 domain-containing protein [Trichonephila clavipes]|nr:DUF4817 domain-containing protein [Trichonephila clavipes]